MELERVLDTNFWWEALWAMVRANPRLLVALVLWRLRGRPYFESQIDCHSRPEIASLPYHAGVVQHLKNERSAGRRVVLVTGAAKSIGRRVASHLGCFHEVAETAPDLSSSGLTVGLDGHSVAGRLTAEGAATAEDRERSRWRRYVKSVPAALRIVQWSKNGLVLFPVVAGLRIAEPDVVFRALLMFAAFSLCASAVYIMNDVLDLEADRRHPTKRKRPFASGALPLAFALYAVPLLLAGAFATAYWLPFEAGVILACYLVATLAYSTVVKKHAIADVLLLAGLYATRVVAGGFATGILISPWTTTFAMCLFLSLALLKRFSELQCSEAESRNLAHMRRGYDKADLEQLRALGSSSGYGCALVLALYLNSREVQLLYSRPEWLWLVCPIIVYWITRMWLLAGRTKMQQDPIAFVLKDKCSYVLGAATAVILLVAH